MISCDKCGYGHRTFKEKSACKSWAEMQLEIRPCPGLLPPEQWDVRRAAWYLSKDAVLGCWCKPEACHGDIIAGYLAWRWEKQPCLYTQL